MNSYNSRIKSLNIALLRSTTGLLPLAMVTAAIVAVTPTIVMAQATSTINVTPRPVADALKDIQAQSGVVIEFDPDAVPGLTSAPVQSAANAQAAVQQAIAGTGLSIFVQADGGMAVGNAITVTAQRDEAETSILVRQNSTSNRNGTPLRDQARNAQVVSSKQMEEQQSRTVRDALRYAGGVSGGVDTGQGQGTFYLRGFPVTPVINGLAGAGTVGSLGSLGGNIDTVERIEVLKGPDAMLAGSGNLGGVVNIVTKKPFADFFAAATGEVGLNFADWRLSGDVNGALSSSELLSARVIASVWGGDTNYGGYRAADGYVIAPSIRFKNARTDILLSATLTDEFVPISPYALIPFGGTEPFDLPRDQPIIAADQGISIKSQRYLVDIAHDFSSNLTAVLRYQHQYAKVAPGGYTLFGAEQDGTAFVSSDEDRQRGPTNAFDGFIRAKFTTGPIRHTVNAGFVYVKSRSDTDSALGEFLIFNIFTDDPSTLPPLPTDFVPSTTASFEQKGFYAQNLMQYGPVHLILGIRRTDFSSRTVLFARPDLGLFDEFLFEFEDGATTPSAGIIVDVADNVSLFANYLRGFSPTFGTDFAGRALPNVRSTNREAGVKLDLFGNRAVLNASYFHNEQSNILITDPVNGPPFQIAGPGLLSKGIDLNLAGEILPGWSIIASYTRTDYRNLSDEFAEFVVIGNARDTYSAFTSYAFDLGSLATASVNAGISGRSSAFASVFGEVISPAAMQVDLGAAVTVKGINWRLGVRNLLDRRNYDVSFVETQLPISEPRNVRLTASFRF